MSLENTCISIHKIKLGIWTFVAVGNVMKCETGTGEHFLFMPFRMCLIPAAPRGQRIYKQLKPK
jgi:hypothetical protein